MAKTRKRVFHHVDQTPTNELQNKALFIITINLDDSMYTLKCMSFQSIHIRVGVVFDAENEK